MSEEEQEVHFLKSIDMNEGKCYMWCKTVVLTVLDTGEIRPKLGAQLKTTNIPSKVTCKECKAESALYLLDKYVGKHEQIEDNPFKGITGGSISGSITSTGVGSIAIGYGNSSGVGTKANNANFVTYTSVGVPLTDLVGDSDE